MTIKLIKIGKHQYINADQITYLYIDPRDYQTSDNKRKTIYVVSTYIPNDSYLCRLELARFETMIEAETYLENTVKLIDAVIIEPGVANVNGRN